MSNWLNNLLGMGSVTNKTELIKLLKDSVANGVIDSDSLPIIEAALYINDLRANDVMIPRNQIDVIDINESVDEIANKVIATGHSRFPVIDGEISKILGIFHSKDLLRYFVNKQDFAIKQHVRQAFFVPEIKKLDSLMYEMRMRHSHLAIVVDEFTNVVGMITLEMIIEQIIGDIEDEYDPIEGERDIVELGLNSYRVKGSCKLKRINETVGLNLRDDKVESVGGFFVKFLGRLPIVGEILEFENLRVEIISADSRKIILLNLTIRHENAVDE
jgi:magnesium and cobalt transporter